MAPAQVTLGHMAHSSSGLQEPGVVELKNGVLWAWARTDLGRQYEMFSMDGGEHWSDSQPSWFTGPCSPLSVKTPARWTASGCMESDPSIQWG